MAALADLIGEATRDDGFDLEIAALGSDDVVEITAALSEFLASRALPVKDWIFYRRGTGIVVGALLPGGRKVVLKVHRWRASVDRLEAVQAVQQHLSEAGLPVPRPLLAPEPLGAAVVTVEELLCGGTADGHDPRIRRVLASALASFVAEARGFEDLAQLGQAVILGGEGDSLWPEPHDLRFDFRATARGAEWIDDLARLARSRLGAVDLGPVVGHLDWCVGNIGFSGLRCTAIYDWDSVGLAPEPAVVGAASAQFSADWARGASLPTLAEMDEFVDAYENVRGRSFEAAEREALDAANLLQCAYGARCQHSDAVLAAVGAQSGGGWIELLERRSAHRLR